MHLALVCNNKLLPNRKLKIETWNSRNSNCFRLYLGNSVRSNIHHKHNAIRYCAKAKAMTKKAKAKVQHTWQNASKGLLNRWYVTYHSVINLGSKNILILSILYPTCMQYAVLVERGWKSEVRKWVWVWVNKKVVRSLFWTSLSSLRDVLLLFVMFWSAALK